MIQITLDSFKFDDSGASFSFSDGTTWQFSPGMEPQPNQSASLEEIYTLLQRLLVQLAINGKGCPITGRWDSQDTNGNVLVVTNE